MRFRRTKRGNVGVPCGLVLRSVGYRGVAMPGVPFRRRKLHDPGAYSGRGAHDESATLFPACTAQAGSSSMARGGSSRHGLEVRDRDGRPSARARARRSSSATAM